MEKKNTILLTVIAIATLLVAVVGATFAYFTAKVQTDPSQDDTMRTTTVTTAVLPTATMTMGDQIKSVDDNAVYPGAKFVRDLTVTGACPPGTTTCSTTKATLEITATIDPAFGDDVKWSLYEAIDGQDIEACVNTPVVNANQYSTNATCTGLDAYSTATPVKTGTRSGTEKVDINVQDGTNIKYYLVLEYTNNESAEQDQQGKNFNVLMNFYATGTEQTTTD